MRVNFEFGEIAGKQSLKNKVINKFSALEKYLSNVKDDFHEALVKISKGERWGYKVKVDIKLPGREVVTESRSESLLDAIDESYHKSSRIIRKYFEKLKDKRRRLS